jgi:type I restriction enzyme R subunit
MEYGHQQAVADGVNVGYDIYRIRTAITEGGSTVEAGIFVDKRDRATRKVRWEELDEELTYTANQLDRDVVAQDQIRTIIQTFKERLYTEIFPGRNEVPKTLIFAKDDSHADDIVQIVRDVFGRGNDFCQKITYRTTGAKPEELLASFRNSFFPRVVVTVDMIATGTDIKPLEIVMFMRSVRSRNFFEQMKGRGVRVISPTDFQQVTPGAHTKDHFVLIDCVGVTETQMLEEPPLEKKYGVSFENLMKHVSFGGSDPEMVSSLANRLARLDRQLGKAERARIEALSGGQSLTAIVSGIIEALDPDRQLATAREVLNLPHDAEPEEAALAGIRQALIEQALEPLAANPDLRNALGEIKQSHEQTIDKVSKDELIEAGYSQEARDRAAAMTASFREFIEEHKDQITALQILYNRPYGQRVTYKEIKALAEAIKAPPRAWTPEKLWQAYETLEQGRVRGSGQRTLTDLVALIRFTLGQETELAPFEESVDTRFAAWLAAQETSGRRFTAEQRRWLEQIRDHVAASLQIEMDDFEYTPFNQSGGLGKVHELFGDDLPRLLDELNEVLVA